MIVLDQLTYSQQKRCACIGCFDGIHIGHREIIAKSIEYSKKNDCISMVYTFSPFKDAMLLMSEDQKISLIESLGIDQYFCRKFTPEFAGMAPEDFVKHLKEANISCVVVGQDFTFGKGGMATSQDLEAMCSAEGMDAIVVPLVTRDGSKVSSTIIRQAMSCGDIEKAKFLMGGSYGK